MKWKKQKTLKLRTLEEKIKTKTECIDEMERILAKVKCSMLYRILLAQISIQKTSLNKLIEQKEQLKKELEGEL